MVRNTTSIESYQWDLINHSWVGTCGAFLKINPNPVVTDSEVRINYNLGSANTAEIIIYDLNRSRMQSVRVQNQNGERQISIPLPAMIPGMYNINLVMENSRIDQKLLIVK